MDREAFFAGIRTPALFSQLSQDQVDGINAILDEAERRGTPAKHLAYMLATAFHETARTMQPVRETLASTDDKAIAILESSFKRGKLPWVKTPYWRKDANGKSWLGRGLVQLTHYRNYLTMANLIKVDLVNDPGKAMDMDVAVKIMFEGMERGSFTGKKLSDYLTLEKSDWKNARRIINGIESADKVAAYAVHFLKAIVFSGYDGKAKVPVREEKPAPAPKLPEKEASSAGWVGALIKLINAIFGAKK